MEIRTGIIDEVFVKVIFREQIGNSRKPRIYKENRTFILYQKTENGEDVARIANNN